MGWKRRGFWFWGRWKVGMFGWGIGLVCEHSFEDSLGHRMLMISRYAFHGRLVLGFPEVIYVLQSILRVVAIAMCR